jgi:hypothetical protein
MTGSPALRDWTDSIARSLAPPRAAARSPAAISEVKAATARQASRSLPCLYFGLILQDVMRAATEGIKCGFEM